MARRNGRGPRGAPPQAAPSTLSGGPSPLRSRPSPRTSAAPASPTAAVHIREKTGPVHGFGLVGKARTA
jgi:hypothetical protein